MTAIFAANDSMALGALKALSEAKVAVPAKMSLIGFDNLPESEFLVPELTTVVQTSKKLVRAHSTCSLRRLRAKISTKRLAITPTLAIRASTAKAPISNSLVTFRIST